MAKPSFESVTQRLLAWGIAPKYASRLRRELQDHYSDLEQDALRSEASPEAAAVEARRRLGADHVIVDAFLRQPELRSRARRLRLPKGWLPTLGRFAMAGAGAVPLLACCLLMIQAVLHGASRTEPTDFGIPISRVELVERPQRAGQGPREAERVSPPVDRPSLDPQPRRPSYSGPRDPWPPPPMLQIASVAPDAGVAPPQFRIADGDLQPIVRVAPAFPMRAAARGLEGYVVVEYTVTRAGSVTDLVVVESSNAIFEQPALEAAGKFRYRPRVIGGQPVAVRGVRARMSFVLDV